MGGLCIVGSMNLYGDVKMNTSFTLLRTFLDLGTFVYISLNIGDL